MKVKNLFLIICAVLLLPAMGFAQDKPPAIGQYTIAGCQYIFDGVGVAAYGATGTYIRLSDNVRMITPVGYSKGSEASQVSLGSLMEFSINNWLIYVGSQLMSVKQSSSNTATAYTRFDAGVGYSFSQTDDTQLAATLMVQHVADLQYTSIMLGVAIFR